MRMRTLIVGLSLVTISLLVTVSLAAAEPYFGLYGGMAFPHENRVKYSEFRLLPTNLLADVTVGEHGFDTSGMIGGNFGYFLDPLPFLGVELDVYNIFGPDIDANKTRTFDVRAPTNIPAVAPVTVGNITAPLSQVINTGPEIELRVTSVMLNVIGRVPLMRSADFPQGRLNPYLGVGGGW